MNKPKILFVYDHKNPEYWMDGLWAALNVLEEDFDIKRYNIQQLEDAMPPYRYYDFELGWGSFNSTVDRLLQENKLKYDSKHTGLCIAGNATPPTGADNYDVLFYETKWYRPQINFHKNIVQAFGVNTDLYFPMDMPNAIVWDYIGVGAFASWKRWEKMINKKGNKLVIGEYQDNNEGESLSIVQQLIKGNVAVSNMISPYDLSNLYHWSRKLYMPSDVLGGGERAVLEARACGLEVEIEDDNPKLKELLELEVIPSHIDYAQKLKEGILSVI